MRLMFLARFFNMHSRLPCPTPPLPADPALPHHTRPGGSARHPPDAARRLVLGGWEAFPVKQQGRQIEGKFVQPVEVNLPCCLSSPCSLPDLASGGVNLKLDTLNGAALQVRC